MYHSLNLQVSLTSVAIALGVSEQRVKIVFDKTVETYSSALTKFIEDSKKSLESLAQTLKEQGVSRDKMLEIIQKHGEENFKVETPIVEAYKSMMLDDSFTAAEKTLITIQTKEACMAAFEEVKIAQFEKALDNANSLPDLLSLLAVARGARNILSKQIKNLKNE